MTPIARGLALTALFGCARHDADRDQLEKIRLCAGLLRDPDVPTRQILERLFEIMGDGWDPRAAGEHGRWLTRLLEAGDDENANLL